MPEYLTKEEIKEWRSSLEKITLEEFAARRGKVLAEQKHTNDLADRYMSGQSPVTIITPAESSEKLTTIKPKKEVKPVKKVEEKVPEPIIDVKTKAKVTKEKPAVKTEAKKSEPANVAETTAITNFDGVEFEKPLTDREQKVFEMFYKHKGHIVYAKDLADLLALPRDYVYKYIKTLRAKIKGDKLENADKGGYVLKI